jgi:hypothetical protein
MTAMRETDLYLPVKVFLEGQGYAVKSEVAGADVVACRGDEAPVIVEMKTGFSLALLRQGVARQAVTDWVYLAIPKPAGRAGQQALKANLTLCRRLGLGVLLVRVSDGFVEPRLDPGPYQPRKSKPRQGRLLREFARRSGDPNTGGVTQTTIVTAYRQDALRCAAHLDAHGPSKGSDVARATGVVRATRMMADDHYGWFERVETGIYALTERGAAALAVRAGLAE